MNSTFNNISYEIISLKQKFLVSFDADKCKVQTSDFELVFSVMFKDQQVFIRNPEFKFLEQNVMALMTAMGFFFDHYKEVNKIWLEGFGFSVLDPLITDNGLYLNQDYSLTREQYYQMPFFWHRQKRFEAKPVTWATTDKKEHPLRSPYQDGIYYNRYVPEISKTISLRKVNIKKDLDLFHEWHNKPRVYDLWELNQDKEKLKKYLEAKEKDAHTLPLILEFDSKPVGYFEVYWVLEDRLAPYYDCSPYDRGFHFLIGEEDYLGIENTGAVLRSISHFIFIDDPRTLRIAAEPRADNQRVLKYVQMLPGWKFIKEFDFPHKRAALLMCYRETFFVKDAL